MSSAKTPVLYGFEYAYANATNNRERARILRLAARRKELLDGGLAMDEIIPVDGGMTDHLSYGAWSTNPLSFDPRN